MSPSSAAARACHASAVASAHAALHEAAAGRVRAAIVRILSDGAPHFRRAVVEDVARETGAGESEVSAAFSAIVSGAVGGVSVVPLTARDFYRLEQRRAK